jgi:hypothetical protein
LQLVRLFSVYKSFPPSKNLLHQQSFNFPQLPAVKLLTATSEASVSLISRFMLFTKPLRVLIMNGGEKNLFWLFG